MRNRTKIAMLLPMFMLIVGLGGISFAASGCDSAEKTSADHPQGEHPEGDHPEGDHPEGDHPDND